MADIIELSEVDLNTGFDPIDTTNLNSSNFGGGLELLMNDKVKENNHSSSDVNLDDLNKLENELNDLSEEVDSMNVPLSSDLFETEKHSVKFNDDLPSIGKSTADVPVETKTWDGFDNFNNVPINPDRAIPSQPQMTKEELLREKFQILRKLESLEKKGVELSKKYNMDSSLQEMQGEYETIMEEKAKLNSIKFQGNMLLACINGVEFLNSRFDPFDVKLDGWSEQINENITDYDDIFAELYDKYKSKAKMAPELKLLFQLGGSAMMVHMSNTLFKSAMPGMDDIFRQNPDLMRSFQSAAVNSMGQSAPGLSGFMNNMMDSSNGPPPPMATQGPNSVPPPIHRPGNNNSMSNIDDGINLRENHESVNLQDNFRSARTSRPEMKGPSDINDILSGLKTKNINIQEASPPSTPKLNIQQTDNSTISISDLKSLQSEANPPRKSKRRQKSASNTISLDI
jgi:hypothetical protein